MRISAIMAAYNAERYVGMALDSVLAQTLPPDEIIVIDDGSTDRTLEILRSYAGRITILSQENSGPGRALNVAMDAASGDAFAFLDADDLWRPEKLKIQNAVLSAEEDLEAVFGAIQQFISPELDPEIASTFVVPDQPQPGISKTTMLIRRVAFERIGPFEEVHTAADSVDWFARANALKLRSRMMPEVVALRRQHSGNLGRLRRSEQHDDILRAIKRSLDLKRGKSRPGAGS